MGVEFQGVERSRLRVRGWSNLPADDRQVVNDRRAELLALLRAEQESPARQPAITPRDYAALGLMTVNGVVTHPLGDQHAADILAGRISRSAAEEMQQQAERSARGLAHAKKWRPSHE
jgi:hypothetical protein